MLNIIYGDVKNSIYNTSTPLYNFFIKKYRTGLSDV